MKGIKNTNVKYIIVYGEAVENTFNDQVKSVQKISIKQINQNN